MDRLEAVATRMRVEQRELLAAVHEIVRVVDVEHDRCGRLTLAIPSRGAASRSTTALPLEFRLPASCAAMSDFDCTGDSPSRNGVSCMVMGRLAAEGDASTSEP